MSQRIEISRNPNLSIPVIESDYKNVIQQRFGNAWWTGLPPERCPGFHSLAQELRALPLIDLNTCTRQEVKDYFNNSWTLTELLFASLKNDEAFTRPPYHGLRHPLIFYYGHPAVLYINKLRVAGLIDNPVDLYLEKILETGVDEMSWDDMSKNEMQWPSVEEVHQYRSKVYRLILDLIDTHLDLDLEHRNQMGSKLDWYHPLWALFMGIEHEKIHFETSSVLIRELPIFFVETPRFWPKLNRFNEQPQSPKWVRQSGQTVTYGKTFEASTYGWDNEYGSRTVEVKDFLVTDQLISNYDFYEFVKSGAYIEDRYWSQEGLMWRKYRNTKRPTFWVAHGPEGLHDYRLRTIFEVIEMPWSWPVEVNFHEAQAYCNWKQEVDKTDLKYRLLTESEYQVLLQKNLAPGYDPVVKGDTHYNFNFQSSSPRSVHSDPDEVKDIMGNVWQWALDQFNPLDGFKVHPYYDDFSTPCFDGKHQMILGGSFISCGHEASRFARFHFRPHFFQHAGFRMAATCDGSHDNQARRIKNSQSYIHAQRQETLKQMEAQEWWKHVFQPLEIDFDYFDQALQFVSQNALKYWSEVYNKVNPIMGKALDGGTHKLHPDIKLDYTPSTTFPEHALDLKGVIDFLFQDIAPLGQKVGAPGYMGYVAGAAHPVSIIGQLVAHVLNQFTAHHTMAMGLVALEVEALNWFINLVGYPKSAKAIFTSGGSIANMQALACARDRYLKTADYINARVYASAHVHHCIGKSLSFIGLPKSALRLVPVDQAGRMQLSSLKAMIQEDLAAGYKPFCIVGTMGTTNAGAIDPVPELLRIKNEYNLWLHIDGAYGFSFYLTPSIQKQIGSLAEADSIVFDPHKGFQVPYGTGCLMLKNGSLLSIDYAGYSDYMPPSPEVDEFSIKTDFADLGPELSRDPRGLRVWLPIKIFGIQPFILNLEEKLKLTQQLYDELKQLSGIELYTQPELSVTVFRFKDDTKTRDLMRFINERGEHFLSSTWIHDKLWIRVCLLGYRVHWAQVQSLLGAIKTYIS